MGLTQGEENSMLKKIIYVLLLLSFLVIGACAPSVVNWDIRMQQPVAREGLEYSDEKIAISFSVDDKSIVFDLKNKTDSGIKVNYDDLAYISPGGVSLRVVTSNVRFVDRFTPQAPVVVPPGLHISETLIPAQNIFFRTTDYIYGWDVVPLFPNNAQTYVGKEFGLYFPMEIKGTKAEYIFKFKVHGVKK